MAVVLALVAHLRLEAEAERAHRRERLLAGHLESVDAGALASSSVPGEALVLGALTAGRLDDAAAVARLMRETGDPLGPLYTAVAAFESGDEPAARRALAASRVAPSARGLGARLERALAARDAGARTLLLDRSGELVATVTSASSSSLPLPAGFVHLAPDAAGLLPGLLERLPPEAVSLAGSAAAEGVPALRLAVDLDLSRAALAALGDARGSIVLVDTASGAVLAAVADARTLALEPAAPFAQRREPASIAKLLTAAAAYRAGLDADAEIARMSCGGVERYGGEMLWCPVRLGPLSGLDHALAQSCNIAFANLGVRLGGEAMQAEYARWGFRRPDRRGHAAGDSDGDPGGADGGSDVRGSGGGSGGGSAPGPDYRAVGDAGRVHTPHTPRQLADLSVGLGLADVTPLHAALLAAAVASGGRLPQPLLVDGPCGPLGLRRPSASSQAPEGALAGGVRADGAHPDGVPAVGAHPDGAHAGSEALDPVLPPAVARRLRQAMVEVVRTGTGFGLEPPDFPVAMKTGTAAEPGQGYHVNYVGFGPLPEASLAFCVRVTHERSSPAVTRRARDVTRRLLQALADRRGQVLRFAARSKSQG